LREKVLYLQVLQARAPVAVFKKKKEHEFCLIQTREGEGGGEISVGKGGFHVRSRKDRRREADKKETAFANGNSFFEGGGKDGLRKKGKGVCALWPLETKGKKKEDPKRNQLGEADEGSSGLSVGGKGGKEEKGKLLALSHLVWGKGQGLDETFRTSSEQKASKTRLAD